MNESEQKPALLAEEVWPPPPTISAQSLPEKSRSSWFRPAFWLGVGFNLLACVPPLIFLVYPADFRQMSQFVYSLPGRCILLVIVPLALLVGIPLCVRQMRERNRQSQSIGAEITGLLLCLTPFFAGIGVLDIVYRARAANSPP